MPSRLAALVAAGALAVALAGCGTSQRAGAPVASATNAAASVVGSPSPAPARLTPVVSVATPAPVTTALPLDDTSGGAVASVPLDPSLAPALLTVADLPSGWVSTDSGSADGASSLFDSSDSNSTFTSLCGNDRLDDGVIGQNSTGFAPADFSDGLRIVVDGIARYQPGKAKAALTGFQQALQSCGGTITQTDENGTLTLTVEPLSLPSLGDQAAGFHVAAQSAPFALGLSIVVVRQGDLLAVVADFDLGSDVPQDGLLPQLAATAASRLARVAQ